MQSGVVVEVRVKEGSDVKVGDPIAGELQAPKHKERITNPPLSVERHEDGIGRLCAGKRQDQAFVGEGIGFIGSRGFDCGNCALKVLNSWAMIAGEKKIQMILRECF